MPSPVIEAVPCEMEVGASRVSFKHLSAKKKQVEESWKWLETKIGVWQLDFKKNDDS